MRFPSLKALRANFRDGCEDMRRIGKMSRAQLLETPAGAARNAECYHPPQTWDLRMVALNKAGEFGGVEHAETVGGEFASYLNAGDCYAPTIIYWRGRYRIACLGDFVETMERRGIRFK